MPRGSLLAAAAILTLGIGMSVAIFSLVDAVLLRPLPFPDQERIQVIWKSDPLAGSHVEELAYPELGDLQRNIPEFESVALMPTSLYGYARILQRPAAPPLPIEAAPVSHDFFRVLGVKPALGRDFNSSDEHVGAPPAVILSDRIWRDEFGADPSIAGRLIQLNGTGHTVIGVMARGVEFPRGAGLWVPLGTEARIVGSRGASFLQAVARLEPRARREGVAAEVNGLFIRLAREYPEFYSASQRGVVTPLVEYWTGSARTHLWIMMGASALLLLASIVSAGNLLLSRAFARRTEIATRMALGAGRWRILRLLGSEAATVAIAAALAGLAAARLAIGLLVRMAPPDIPRLTEAGLNGSGFFFAAGCAVLAALICTLAPGWTAIHTRIESALREGAQRASLTRGAGRMRGVFIASQSALTVVLLAAAALLVFSYREMMSADIGFANRDAVTMNLQLRGPGVLSGQAFGQEKRRTFYSEFLDRLRAAPGVTSAAAILLRPLEGTIGWDVPYRFDFDPREGGSHVLPKVNYEVITPRYFQTVGTALLEGRDFDERDSASSERVAIVSGTLADRARNAGHSPVGYRIWIGLGGWAKVVGVVSDARYRGITQAGSDIFVPYLQAAPPTNYLVIRGSRPAGELAALVRETLAKMDPAQAVAGVETIGELIDGNAARHRFNMTLLLCFGVCACLLAAGGVYAAIAESVTARSREIAIRNALGAQRSRLIRYVASRTLWFVAAGETVGLAAVFLSAGYGSGLLYRVSARDPRILAAVAVYLFAVSFAAALLPAWRAAATDPTNGLRAS